jgi:hypothetical protein
MTVGGMVAVNSAPIQDLYYVATAAFSTPTSGTFIYQLDASPAGYATTAGYVWTNPLKYNTAMDTWTTVRKIPTARAVSSNEQGAMAAKAASSIYVMGGGNPMGQSGAWRAKVEMYSPLTDAWTTKANMPGYHVGAVAGVWGDSFTTGTVLIAGGYGSPFPASPTALHLYNAATDVWRAGTAPLLFVQLVPSPDPRHPIATFGAAGASVPSIVHFASGSVKGNVFYVAGGQQSYPAPVATNAVWMYNVVADSWQAGTFHVAHGWAGGCVSFRCL